MPQKTSNKKCKFSFAAEKHKATYNKMADISAILLYSRRESNSYLSFRRATFYPLNYESRNMTIHTAIISVAKIGKFFYKLSILCSNYQIEYKQARLKGINIK